MGISSNFLLIIQSMYKDVYYCVKLGNEITNCINSNVGVKQGCVLSPSLFNLYLADLPEIFSEECHPVTNFDSTLNCLMFADDIVLMSETADGLQNCINKLQVYSEQWKLALNTTKTKVIIFNAGGHKFTRFKFHYNCESLEITQSYCYLGIQFTACGTFRAACDAILSKSLKAFFKLRQIDTRDNVNLTMKLFDNLVRPICSYGSEVWAPLLFLKMNDKNLMHLCDNAIIEKINVKL